MAEYIEREAVVAFLENMAASRYLVQCFENKEKFPAADVVEVVRCKDCKYHFPPPHPESEYAKCKHSCLHTKMTDFCSYGERKVDNAKK